MKIFINPGHSKDCKPDCGATNGKGKYEATIAAQIGYALVEELKKTKIETVLFQQQGSQTANQQLNDVPRKANVSGADLFLSIHMNAASASAKGIEALFSKGSTNGRKFAELLTSELAKPFATYTFTNRGAKIDVRNLLVLRATKMPAALVEVGFISNQDDCTFVVNHIKEIAQRLSVAIQKYYGVYTVETAKVQSKTETEIKLVHVEEDKYDVYVNKELKLASNKFSTCLEYLKKHHGV